MSEFRPISTVRDYHTLDESDVFLGYMDGFEGAPPPGSGHSRGYFHGWRNGMIEAGFAEPDRAYETLAVAFREVAHRH